VWYSFAMIRAVVVDVDDTLCLTEAVTFDIENEVLRRMNRRPMERAVHLATWGQSLAEALPHRSPGINIDVFNAIHRTVLPDFIKSGKLDTIPPENYNALDRLIAQGFKIMLLSSRTHSELGHMLAPDHLLASKVTAFYYSEKTAYRKPDPRVFDELLRDNTLRPRECVYVGDSPSDAAASIQGGLSFIASLESGIRQRKDFKDYNVAAFINKFPEVVAAVAALNK
jgi:phosphoglycolate phosphatase